MESITKMQELANMYKLPGYLIRRTHQTASVAFASATNIYALNVLNPRL